MTSTCDPASEGPEDPLVRIMRLAEEEDRLNQNIKTSLSAKLQGATSRIKESGLAPWRNGRKRNHKENGDPSNIPTNDASKKEEDDDDDEVDELARKDIIARIIAETLATEHTQEGSDGDTSLNSSPEDPLAKLMTMEEDIETQPVQPRNEGKASRKRSASSSIRNKESPHLSDQEIIKRIVAMRLAAIDDEGGSDYSTHSTPYDPLERINNMNAEDQLIAAASLVDYTDDNDEGDDDVAIICRRDFRELNKMIQENDLNKLKWRTAMLADEVKSRLTVTTSVADLQQSRHDSSANEKAGRGYLALAMGEHKEVVNRSHVMSGLDISKITTDGDDEDNDKCFISVSDSILESPARANKHRGTLAYKGLLSPESDDSIDSIESDPTELTKHNISDKNDDIPPVGDGRKGTIEDQGFPSNDITRSKTRTLRKRSTQHCSDSLAGETDFVSHWWGVLDSFASIRSDWSDSQSTTTNHSILSSEPASSLEQVSSSQNKRSDQPATATTYTCNDYDVGLQQLDSRVLPKTKVDPSRTVKEKQRTEKELKAWKASLAQSLLRSGA